MSSQDSPIPIITLEDTPECAAELLDAAQRLGFLYIKLDGCGIPDSEINRMFEISKGLFALPGGEKQAYAITADNRGWGDIGTETLDPATQKRGDFKQAFNIYAASIPSQPFPPLLIAATPTLQTFTASCQSLCQRLLRLFATALSISLSSGGPSYFDPSHATPGSSALRLLYYPPVPETYGTTAGDMRAGAHSDYGSLTLLFQRPGQSGLEILMPNGGWRGVPVVEGAVCVNIGDLLSYWTAGLLKSTVHRVVAKKGEQKERYSMVYFCHPVGQTQIVPIPSEIVRQRGSRGANEQRGGGVLTAAEHLKTRLAATYGWGKEKKDTAKKLVSEA